MFDLESFLSLAPTSLAAKVGARSTSQIGFAPKWPRILGEIWDASSPLNSDDNLLTLDLDLVATTLGAFCDLVLGTLGSCALRTRFLVSLRTRA